MVMASGGGSNNGGGGVSMDDTPGPSPQSVGREFVRQYYTLLHQAPLHLHRFYKANSSFVHGGLEVGAGGSLSSEPVVGQQEIHKRIMQLNFRDCHAKIRQVDAHATLGDGVVVQVSGELSNGGQPMRRFMQTFVLASQSAKMYYVHNDIFRYQDEVYDDDGNDAAVGTNGSGANAGVEQKGSGPITVSINPGAQQQQVPSVPEQAAARLHAEQQAKEQQRILEENGNKAAEAAAAAAAAALAAEKQQAAEAEAARQAAAEQKAKEQKAAAARQEQAPPVVASPPAASTLPAPDLATPANNAAPDAAASSPLSSSASSASNAAPPAAAPSGGPISYANLVKSSKAAPPQAPVVSVREVSAAAQEKDAGQQQQQVGGKPQFAGRRSGGPPSHHGGHQQSEDGGNDDGNNAPYHGGHTYRGRGGMGRGGGMMGRGGGSAGSGAGEGGSLNTVVTYPDSQQVFVGNLPHDCTDAELKTLFGQWGGVVDIRINNKGATQAKTTPNGTRVPNFGFIVFDSDSAVRRCLDAKPIHLSTDFRPHSHRLNVEEKKMKVPERGSMRRERGDYDHVRGGGAERGRGGSMRGAPRGGPKGGNPGAPNNNNGGNPYPRRKSPYQQQMQQGGNS